MADEEAISIEDDRKPWDETRPFQRLRSPSFNFLPNVAGEERLDGDGHARGTRRSSDFPVRRSLFGIPSITGALIRDSIRLTPSWSRTLGPFLHGDAAERRAEHEVYGRLVRSFQTWTDAPGFQWHRWYDWNFHVKPAKEFDWLRGKGNLIAPTPPAGLQFVVEGAMECEWDMGAIDPRRRRRGRAANGPGPMFNEPDAGQQDVDWAWPMTGDWVWIAGRSIYDGGHEFQKDARSPLLCRSELHPCKAVANVRKEAFRFAENGHFTPANQFAFFACRRGGYVSPSSLAPPGDDYQFVVDLPLMPDVFVQAEHAIGATGDFPLNTIVLRRPDPLIDLNFNAHQNAAGRKLSPAQLRANFAPIIEIIQPPGESDERKRQALITIPLKRLVRAHPDVESYGVIISLGWPDPDRREGRKVKRCRVNFINLHAAEIKGDLLSGDEWRFKIGVNNRWFHWERDGIFDEDNFLFGPTNFRLALPRPIEFFLHEDESIRLTMHGSDLNALDDPYQGRDGSRTIKFSRPQVFVEALLSGENPATVLPGDDLSDIAALPATALALIASVPVIDLVADLLLAILGISPNQLIQLAGERVADWNEHIDKMPPRTDGRAHVIQRVIARNSVSAFARTFKDGNAPLGIIDPGHGFTDENPFNPLPVRDRNDASPLTITLRGLHTDENEDLAELFEPPRAGRSSSSIDQDLIQYVLTYSVQVNPQFP
jgi:hypothetical protein